jgi:hypothetical protein
MIRPWDLIVEMWWYYFPRSACDSAYACLVWNATLRRVL